jgi:hypothetical protein
MIHVFLRMALTFLLLLVALVGLIRAQPPDDGELLGFLSVDACSLPCFMGIWPGLTTTQEAVRLLEQHEWVEKVTQHIWFSGPNRSLYSWSWSGLQPALVNDAAPGVFSTHGNVVDVLQVPTTISLGDFWLLNQPQHSMIAREPGQLSYRAIYLGGALQIETALVCPLKLGDFWRAPVQMILSSDAQPDPAAFQLPVRFENTPCP